jgi:hypothetical protein
MTRKHVVYWLVTGAFVAGFGYLFSQGEVITLRAEEPLPVSKSPVKPASGANLVYTLSPGERAEVIKCEDIKTDLVIRLRAGSGEIGYVASGRYSLERRRVDFRVLLSDPKKITFSCKGMFEHRSIS